MRTAPTPGEQPRRWWSAVPGHLGRVRSSTVVLALLFLAIGALYLNVRPETGTAGSRDDGVGETVPVPVVPGAPAPTTPAPPPAPSPTTTSATSSTTSTTTRTTTRTTTPPTTPGSPTPPDDPAPSAPEETGTPEEPTGTTRSPEPSPEPEDPPATSPAG